MSTSAIDNSLIPRKKAFWALLISIKKAFWALFRIALHVTNHHFWFFTEQLEALLCCWSTSSGYRRRWLPIFFTSTWTRKFFRLFHNCMWQSRHSEVDIFSSRCVNKSMDCPVSTGLSVLTWSASAFSSASLSWSQRSTDTVIQLENRSPCSFIDFFRSLVRTFSISEHSIRMDYLQQLLNPILSSNYLKRNFWRISKRRKHFLVCDFSRFYHNNFRDIIDWMCVGKDD